mmetsp:Transcript_25434/g.74982  ORF Transcript_25434/g.74982 Transcript_25434/m.74982 type:complete len:504 (+) Transcript_25434:228-1739(+)
MRASRVRPPKTGGRERGVVYECPVKGGGGGAGCESAKTGRAGPERSGRSSTTKAVAPPLGSCEGQGAVPRHSWSLGGLVAFEDERGVVPAEAEVVGDSNLDGLLGDVLDVRHVVEVAVRVGGLVVDRRRHDARLEHLAHDRRLDAARRTQEVAGGALGRRDLHLVGVLPKHTLVRHRLELVVERRRGAVRVDVLHLLRRHARRLHRRLEARRHPLPLRVRRGDVVRVARGSVARNFAVDLCAAPKRVLLRLKQQHARPLAHHETRAVRVERAARLLRVVVRRGAHRAHRVEARKAERSDRRLGPSGEHHVALAPLQVLERLSDRVRAGRARRHDAVVRPLRPHLNCDHRAGSVADDGGEQEGRDPLRPLVEEDVAAALDGVQPAHAGANEDSEALRVEVLRVAAAVFERHLGSGHREVGVAVLPLGHVRIPVVARLKVLHLGRDCGLVRRLLGGAVAVEAGNRMDAALPFAEVVEEGVRVVSERGERAQARHHHLLLPRSAGL